MNNSWRKRRDSTDDATWVYRLQLLIAVDCKL